MIDCLVGVTPQRGRPERFPSRAGDPTTMAKKQKKLGSLPRQAPGEEKNPAHNLDEQGAYAGKPNQEIKKTTGTGAGGATEWGGGNKNHPSRIAGRPPGT